uniref:CNH domain-containing protein n=1 Tax=Romanomermis culicivorax TaxID=13658 RepID=A0A915I159_ROMCU
MAAILANLIPFASMAMTIPVTPMAITTTAITRKTATAATITNNPNPHQTPVIIAAIESKLLYMHVQLMLRPPSKTAGLVLPPHAPTCAVCPFLPPLPCAPIVTTLVVVAGLILPFARTRMLIDQSKETAAESSDSDSYDPSAPIPPRRRAKHSSRDDTLINCDNLQHHNSYIRQDSTKRPDRPMSQLPATPKVHMGACLLKIFNGCPLTINCTATWVHCETKEQHILIGAEEGIYTLNLNKLHDAMMDRVHPRRCVWMHVTKNVLICLQGRTQYLYRHDLVALHQRDLTLKLSLPMNKMPEKFIPRKLAITTRLSETKECFKCCTARNQYNGYKYLAAAVPKGVILMQWYEPLLKYMILKQVELDLPSNLPLFEMVITPENEYPIVVIRVKKGGDRKHLVFDQIDLNQVVEKQAFQEEDGALRDSVQITNLKGKLKSSRIAPSELSFPFFINHLVFLTDSILAFHEHGVQGRNFADNQVTQDINDTSRRYRVLGSDKIVVLESRSANDVTNSTNSNLHVLTGHEAF